MEQVIISIKYGLIGARGEVIKIAEGGIYLCV